jgi:hypothetical protein
LNFIWDSMWLFLWVIFFPTYLDGLFYSSPNSANYSCSRLLNKTRGIFLKELHFCGFYSHLKQFFRDHCLLQKPNQHSNNTADERFSPLEFSIDKYSYFCHKLVSNYCRPIFRATYSIFHIYLIRCFIFISSSNILSQGTSLLVTPDWLCPLASVMGNSFIFVLTRGSINSPICRAARNKCVRPTISLNVYFGCELNRHKIIWLGYGTLVREIFHIVCADALLVFQAHS